MGVSSTVIGLDLGVAIGSGTWVGFDVGVCVCALRLRCLHLQVFLESTGYWSRNGHWDWSDSRIQNWTSTVLGGVAWP